MMVIDAVHSLLPVTPRGLLAWAEIFCIVSKAGEGTF